MAQHRRAVTLPALVQRLMRLFPATLVLFAAVGCDSMRSAMNGAPGREPSPFMFFRRPDMRAGVPFAELERAARAEQRSSYRCKELWEGARRCSLRVSEATMTALVDGSGRVVRLVYVSDEPVRSATGSALQQGVLKNYVASMRAEWDSVRPSRAGRADRVGAEYRWLDASGRYSGTMWYSPLNRYLPQWQASYFSSDTLAFVPDSIASTDEPAFSALLEKRPVAPQRIAAASATPSDAGPLAAAVPRTPHEALEVLRTNLLQLASAEEEFRSDSAYYKLELDGLLFAASDGVRIEIVEATPRGWSAVASHEAFPDRGCAYFAGRVTVMPRTGRQGLTGAPGEIVCDASGN